MPIKDLDTIVYRYQMSKGGINLYRNIVAPQEDECLMAQNVIWENGMVKRGGQTLLTSTEVNGEAGT